MVNVPSAYQPLIAEMSQGTGIPQSVEAAQANMESGFNATAVSSAGAEGWLQFLPSTYDAVAAQAGVQPGTEFNPADEAKAYVVYMNQLLSQEKGNLRNALAAYNAGPGNLSAGYSYADSILQAAGTSNITVQGGKTASLADIHVPGTNINIPTSPQSVVKDLINGLLSTLGLGSMQDLLERLGLVLLGGALVLLGIHILAGGGSKQPFNINVETTEAATGERTTKRKIKTPVSQHTKTVTRGAAGKSAASKGLATEAVEAAAVA